MQALESTIPLHRDPEDGGYTVTVPALPGCITEGDTIEEAVAMVKEAIFGFVESLEKAGEPVPANERPDMVTIVVAREAAA